LRAPGRWLEGRSEIRPGSMDLPILQLENRDDVVFATVGISTLGLGRKCVAAADKSHERKGRTHGPAVFGPDQALDLIFRTPARIVLVRRTEIGGTADDFSGLRELLNGKVPLW
jgi:hypothetical protein